MSKTGTYKVIDGEVVKVSDRIPSLKAPVYFPSACDHSGYYSEALDKHFYSKDHKRQVMNEMGVAECG